MQHEMSMCGSPFSNQWYDEEVELVGEPNSKRPWHLTDL